MSLSRRDFVLKAAGTVPLVLSAKHRDSRQLKRTVPKIGICDWNLGESCDPGQIPLAASVGIRGIQVSVGTRPDNLPLREAAVRKQYIDLGKRHDVAFPSVAAGSILNSNPLKSEPESAVYVIDALEAALALGSSCILTAFFGRADLRRKDAEGNFLNLSEGEFSEYALDEQGVDRVVAAIKQIVPRAEDLGVIIGLEDTLTANQNLEIMERIGSSMVQVYYDVGNSTGYGYDVGTEILRLGKSRICEIHLKETLGLDDPERGLLGGPANGGVNFEAAAASIREIGFDDWFVLETEGRPGRFEEDSKRNVAFASALLYG